MDQERLWVARAMGGDQTAFASLVETYKTPVYNLCYRMLGNAAEAEDAAQETFLRVYTHLRSYNPARKLSSWVLAVASHYCVDRLRRRRLIWLSLDEEPELEPVSETVHPEEQIVQNESSAEVRSWLQALPTDYRLVITLRYWEDMSYAEIAEVTGATESAVKARLHRARSVLGQQVLDRRELEALPGCATLEGRKVLDHAAL
jgi:RNA polymerase sigma-70 factor (ECF subfamily)